MLALTRSRLLHTALRRQASGPEVPKNPLKLISLGVNEMLKVARDPSHPAGPKTIFFWAPAWKWMLTFASIDLFFRPANKISLNQSFSLMITGAIWSRYSLVITPINYTLFSVNIALFVAYAIQCGRVLHHKYFVEEE